MHVEPVVSVLMPVYNGEQYVAQAVESVLAQTFEDFEFIVIDDGSTDASLKILEAYAAKDERICLISRENRGIARTSNEILSKAKGEFIAIVDADDVALPERFAHQVEFLQHNPDVVCVGGAYQLIDAKGRLLRTCFEMPESNDEIQRFLLAGYAGLHHPCLMIRQASMVEIGCYDEAKMICPDFDVFLKLGEVGKLANLKNPVVKYRVHTNSISEQNRTQQRQEVRASCEQAWRRRGIEGHFEATEPWRSGTDRPSRHRFTLLYGWWAFNSGQRQTAIIYGTRAIAALPFAIEGWKLLACAAIKPLPATDSMKL